MRLFVPIALFAALPLLTGCDQGLCSPSDEPTIALGNGVGGAFEAYEEEQQVQLESAPQGGSGVRVNIETHGLFASDDALSATQLDVLIDGVVEGSFLQENTRLLCAGADIGGRIDGTVAGFDKDKYSSDDELLALNGQVVTLDITVTDEDGNSGSTQQDVTVVYGN